MSRITCIALLCMTLLPIARAQTGVVESLDPARASAIEKAARDIQARAASDAAAGKRPVSVIVMHGKTPEGLAYVSGGITAGDRVSMHAERNQYTLWVATVAKPSGAYLTDATLRIVGLQDKSVVLERQMDGPWFMVALPPGRYEVTASRKPDGAAQPQVLTARVQVAGKGLRQAVLRFDSPVVVDQEQNGPFKGNPFGGPPVKR